MWLFDLFTGSKATDTACNLIDDLSSGVDKMFYTDEEKADARAKGYENWLEAMKITQQESSVRAVTRRVIAISTIFVFLLLILLSVGVYPWIPEYSKFIFTVIDKIFWIVVSVIGFYFSFEGFNFIKKK